MYNGKKILHNRHLGPMVCGYLRSEETWPQSLRRSAVTMMCLVRATFGIFNHTDRQ